MVKKLGLALGSGGAKGFAHVGVIQVLQENNIPIHCIGGSSAGAIVSAYYALNLEVDGIVRASRGFRKRDMIKLLDFGTPKISLIKGERIRNFLKDHFFGDSDVRDAKIPLAIVTTALEDGSAVVMKDGKVVDAVIASGTWPGLLPATEYRGKHVIDGGIALDVPVEILKKMGADVVVAVDLHNLRPKKDDYDNMKSVILRTHTLLWSKFSDLMSVAYDDNDVVVIKPKVESIDTFAFHRGREFIKAGRSAAKKALPKIKKLVK